MATLYIFEGPECRTLLCIAAYAQGLRLDLSASVVMRGFQAKIDPDSKTLVAQLYLRHQHAHLTGCHMLLEG